MEAFGILLSAPLAFIATAIYCLVLRRVVDIWPVVRAVFLVASCAVLLALAGEIALLESIGPGRSHELLGLVFLLLNQALYLLSVPALANVLVLRPRAGFSGRWYVVACICAVLAVILTAMQFDIRDALPIL